MAAALYPQKHFLIPISVRGLGKLKKENAMTSSEIEPTTFRIGA
jgi:hypothetical protein